MSKKSKNLVVILNNIRSAYNVGSILRTSEGAGVTGVYCCGITPYPRLKNDFRPEHVILANTKQIHKAGLEAEELVALKHFNDVGVAIGELKAKSYEIIAIENKVEGCINLFDFETSNKNIALVFGSETDGLDSKSLEFCDAILEIPMHGKKNSLNVSVAAGVAIYYFL